MAKQIPFAIDLLDAQAFFARRSDNLVVWYFPRDEASTSTPFTTGQWLEQGVVLGADHQPGEYEVIVVVSATALDRASVRELAEAGGDNRLLRTKVTVAP